ncbi:MAG TPA: mercury methylation corrinoid protein HgcA [Nitrospirota bacterium]|nr:mercury methylation corrinoid protein HgcA [Nitrospirota bacterium]
MKSIPLAFVKREAPPWTTGTIALPNGPVYRVSPDWSRADFWGMVKSRTGAFRMNYSVPPGLYAMGDPVKESEVFVTANYKLTFDILRRELKDLDAWILVLDTKSINVWCAAGKGTFGTEELIRRVSSVKLDQVVSHRRLILPQLGAVGVSSGEVQKRTGFRVSYGPVEASDIPAYLAAGCRKTPEMSLMKFTLSDRLVLTPMELNPAMKKFPWIAAAILLVFGLQPSGILFRPAWSNGLPFLVLALVALVSGALVTPALLPFIPFRSFAVKGWIVGLLLIFLALTSGLATVQGPLLVAAIYALFPALSSYIALQFTGATTFTGMTGVKKELKFALPIDITIAGAALVLLALFKLKEWGLV